MIWYIFSNKIHCGAFVINYFITTRNDFNQELPYGLQSGQINKFSIIKVNSITNLLTKNG